MEQSLTARAPALSPESQEVAAPLRLRSLTKRYGERIAVDNLTLEARPGEVLGFLGPNGAGKTTTIRMLLGLVTPTSGEIAVFGYDVARERSRALPRVGALIEQPALYPYLTGRDNLRVIGDVQGSVPESRISETLDLVGLGARGGDRVRVYSLGMRQRLGVAMALLRDPDLLVLDEPTNGLDPAGIVEMRDLLRQLAQRGKTVFVSSHLLGEAQHMCDRVAIIHHGRLITVSEVDALTGDSGQFLVATDRASEALALLRREPWGAEAQLTVRGLVTGAPENDGGALNLWLVRAGFAPRSITPYQRDLEAVFLELTAGASGESSAPTMNGGR